MYESGRSREQKPAPASEPARLPVKIGAVSLDHPVALAPMAGMTDTAFRRLVKRKGGCGLVVTEMVSSEGLVRGIDRTLEYAEYTEEERPVSIQIFGGDPHVMADAAQIVEGMGADIVDINMGCPVPKIAKHNAGCSLMREPEHAASVDPRDDQTPCRIPVTVKMRAGWNEQQINAPTLAKHGRGCRRGGGRRARPDGGAVLHRRVGLVADRARRRRRVAFRCSDQATASKPITSSRGLRDGRRRRRAGRPRCAAKSVDLPAGGAMR